MKHGLGVENLSGSGMIAGETSQAYQDTFTISLVWLIHCVHIQGLEQLNSVRTWSDMSGQTLILRSHVCSRNVYTILIWKKMP